MDHGQPAGAAGNHCGTLHVPAYRASSAGRWSLRLIEMAAARGYWGEVQPVGETAILCRAEAGGPDSWMSILPSELESQAIGLAAARGHTVVLGLGMGWLAANVALNPAVDRVTVVEADRDIIALIAATGVLAALPAAPRDKLRIVEGDALDWRPDSPVDTLQADIWLRFVEDRKLADIRRMQANIAAVAVYFWGQEMEIWRLACRRADSVATLDWPGVCAAVAEIGLPLILPDWPDYPERIMAAARWWAPQTPGWWRESVG